MSDIDIHIPADLIQLPAYKEFLSYGAFASGYLFSILGIGQWAFYMDQSALPGGNVAGIDIYSVYTFGYYAILPVIMLPLLLWYIASFIWVGTYSSFFT